MQRIEEKSLSEERLQEFILIYKKVFNEEISNAEASAKASRLLSLFKIAINNRKPIDNESDINSLAS